MAARKKPARRPKSAALAPAPDPAAGTPGKPPAARTIKADPAPLPHEAAKAASVASDRARATTLSEWRRIDLRHAEGARRKADRSLSDIMGGVLKRIRLDQRQAESAVVAAWKQVIDPAVVAHARPVNLAKGTLFVSVDSSPWLAEIVRYRSREILERLQLAAGKDVVQRISFRIG